MFNSNSHYNNIILFKILYCAYDGFIIILFVLTKIFTTHNLVFQPAI